jgi:hypothetical protein
MQNKAIEVIRHSLNAANAALDLLAEPQVERPVVSTVSEAVAEAAPVVEAPVAEARDERKDLCDKLVANMEASRYSLRTLSELAAQTNSRYSYVQDALQLASVVYRTRRSDGAQLVGLSSRN